MSEDIEIKRANGHELIGIMTIGVLTIQLHIPESHQLKDKRMVLNSLQSRVHSNFNVAISQVDDEDKWQKTTLAIVGVEKTRRHLNSLLSDVLGYIQRNPQVSVIEYGMEFL